MPRPPKRRQVCCLPKSGCFAPADLATTTEEAIFMTVEEYETLRLIDLEGATQEECGVRMQIARTTVQSIYREARRKVAEALVKGRQLHIGGGDYQLCENFEEACRGCGRHCRRHCGKGAQHETCSNL